MIRCAGCGNVLGVLTDGVLEMRHRGRRVIAALPLLIGCEDCGATWRPDSRTGGEHSPPVRVVSEAVAAR